MCVFSSEKNPVTSGTGRNLLSFLLKLLPFHISIGKSHNKFQNFISLRGCFPFFPLGYISAWPEYIHLLLWWYSSLDGIALLSCRYLPHWYKQQSCLLSLSLLLRDHVLCWFGTCITTKRHSHIDSWYIHIKPKLVMVGMFQRPWQYSESLLWFTWAQVFSSISHHKPPLLQRFSFIPFKDTPSQLSLSYHLQQLINLAARALNKGY